jgi:G3E family GTPase
MAQAMDTRIPVTILTGFLGSGKTTVLNRALRAPDCPRVAIVVNEFGAIPIDHDLVERSDDDVVLLAGGCACCSVRADLAQALSRLALAVRDGRIPAFEHIVVETTGLADPTPIEQLFMAGLGLERRYRLAGIVTTVDAQLGAATAAAEPVWTRQVALADRLLLTKRDVASAEESRALDGRLAELNVQGEIVDVREAVTARDLLGLDGDHVAGAGAGRDSTPAHGDDIRAASVRFDAPLAGEHLESWLDTLVALHGARLLRLKGLVNVAGESRPLVVHAAQHFVAPPRLLDAWPGNDEATRITFIGHGLAPVDLEAGLSPRAPRPRWQ